VLLLTQACDLANSKTTRVQVAIVHSAQRLVDLGLLKAQTVAQNVRRHQVFGWYFLPKGDCIPESIVDLRFVAHQKSPPFAHVMVSAQMAKSVYAHKLLKSSF
jgi:hypothetical protein